jgi:hypothetical protein
MKKFGILDKVKIQKTEFDFWPADIVFFPQDQEVMTKRKELTQRKPLTKTPRHGEKFSPERRRPRRHQQLSAITLPQLRQTQRVKIRGQFVLSPDSKACFS